MVLDIDLFRTEKGGNPDIIRASQKARYKPVEVVDEIISKDSEWRRARFQIDELNRLKKICSKAFIAAKKKNVEGDASIVEAPSEVLNNIFSLNEGSLSDFNCQQLSHISRHIDVVNKNIREEMEQLETSRDAILKEIGNIVHSTVPVHDDEAFNRIEKIWTPDHGYVSEDEAKSLPALAPKGHSHVDLVIMLEGADLERGAGVLGSRGYFLRGPLVALQQALVQLALRMLVSKNYEPLYPPVMMRKDVMSQVAQLSQFDEELYKVEDNEDVKYMIATSEQPIAAFHRDEWISREALPIKYAGISSCFRKEAGSHGRDTRGIFRVHQFEKIEQFVLTAPEDSWRMHEEMLSVAESFYQALDIPYRVVNIVSGELNNAAAKKYDLEGWFPGSGNFRELVSCSNCLDYQSRRLKVRFGQTKRLDEATEYVHMLNSTMCALTRVMCIIMETYQTETGVEVPKILREFMPEKWNEFLPFVHTYEEVQAKENIAAKKRGKGAAKNA